MKQVFADTLYWVASIAENDAWHVLALQAAASLGQVQVVTTEEVLVEFLSAYASRGPYLRQKAWLTVRAIFTNPEAVVRPQTHESFSRGLILYANRTDKAYSLVDCISMTTMLELGITDVLTNDRHFSQEGFKVLI